jgi:hypothetical protein
VQGKEFKEFEELQKFNGRSQEAKGHALQRRKTSFR